MKLTNHKDKSRSFRFTEHESVCGSQERKQALMDQASVTGGIFSMLADLIEAGESDLIKYTTCLGSEALTILWALCLRSENYPFGQGCKDAAQKILFSRNGN